MARSRRSDEVLVYKGLKCAQILEIKLEDSQRTLAPGFEEDDNDKFPLAFKTLPQVRLLLLHFLVFKKCS